MTSNFFKIISTVLVLISFFSCSEDDSPSLNSEAQITNFSINQMEGEINQFSNTVILELFETDLTSLTPTITVSENASISPASGTSQDFTTPIIYTVTAEDGTTQDYTVTAIGILSPFTFNGKNYEIILDNKSWADAAAIATSRGGYLVEINDEDEQIGIFDALNNALIDVANTIAPDGGGASYVWIGGNDFDTEGDWVWDGTNSGSGTQFWMGDASGMAVGGLYNNWGDEPDNFGSGQDALGLAITDWPLGVAGQWNDINRNNQLHFLIEFD